MASRSSRRRPRRRGRSRNTRLPRVCARSGVRRARLPSRSVRRALDAHECLREEEVGHVWTGESGAHRHSHHRARAIRREQTARAGALPRTLDQRVQEGHQRGRADAGREGQDREGQGRKDITLQPPRGVRMMSLFVPEIGIWEKVLRSVVVYLFVLLAFRFTGKRQVGQLTPFDLVVLLIISNVVQNAVIGPDNSLGGGLLGAAVILGLNYAFVDLTFRSKRLRRLLEATPTLLIHNGQILHQNLKKERITLDDLHAALRRGGVVDAEHVRVAVLEENGGISGVPRAGRGAGPVPGPLTGPSRARLFPATPLGERRRRGPG